MGGRAAIFCAIGAFFSLFGLMHGNNHVLPNGEEMNPLLGTDKLTSDLGEVLFAGAIAPTIHAFGFPLPNASVTGPITYFVNEVGGVPQRTYNEGWRFCVAYSALMLFSLCHFAFQKMKPDVLPAVMDNGKVDVVLPERTAVSVASEPAKPAPETASV